MWNIELICKMRFIYWSVGISILFVIVVVVGRGLFVFVVFFVVIYFFSVDVCG